jgi:hypothetical protein
MPSPEAESYLKLLVEVPDAPGRAVAIERAAEVLDAPDQTGCALVGTQSCEGLTRDITGPPDLALLCERRVQRSKQTMFVADVTSDPWFCRRTAARKAGLVGGLAVPVPAGDSVAAVLVLFGRAVEAPAWPMLAEAAQLAASRLGGPRP